MEREFNKPSAEPEVKAKQLRETIEATKNRIKKGDWGIDSSELGKHLKGLERELEETIHETEEADKRPA